MPIRNSTPIFNRLDREAYFRDWCTEIKRQVSVPVMMVGGLRSFDLMEEVIQNHEADFVSLCRPFIREPGIIQRVAEQGPASGNVYLLQQVL